MEHKTYIGFLSQIASDSSGVFETEGVKIFFCWNSSRAKMSFSSPLDHSSKDLFQQSSGCKKLELGRDCPYFEIRNDRVFLTHDIQGIPTYIEFKSLVNVFVEMFQEFDDQSMGVFPHSFK